jgi:superfamily II DNA or RNA helicase
MLEQEIDLLAVERGTITAPAGCGKTQLVANALAGHAGPKPILVLTHTNAGVGALRARLDKAGVPHARYASQRWMASPCV